MILLPLLSYQLQFSFCFRKYFFQIQIEEFFAVSKKHNVPNFAQFCPILPNFAGIFRKQIDPQLEKIPQMAKLRPTFHSPLSSFSSVIQSQTQCGEWLLYSLALSYLICLLYSTPFLQFSPLVKNRPLSSSVQAVKCLRSPATYGPNAVKIVLLKSRIVF